jgi:hypothetical protein
MKKSLIIGGVIAGFVILGGISSVLGQSTNSSYSNAEPVKSSSPTKTVEKVVPLCDGTIVTQNCTLEGVSYSTYVYHSAVAEKSHEETTTTYEQKVTSYCTLCNDGTYSPSCATGRGACSHHDGVAQWNAPRYSNVPVQSVKKIIDSPAQDAYYEKVLR